MSRLTSFKLLALVPLWALGACEGGTAARDAQARPNAESAEVSVRFDLGAGQPPAVHVLAFRATVSTAPGAERPDVLGTVDLLAAAGPEQGCSLRDVDAAASALIARGASIELEEMTGIGVGLGGAGSASATDLLLRPFPRLYPDVATVVGGVVTELGPQALAALPERVSLYTAETELPVTDMVVPPSPHIVAVNGAAPVPSMRLDAQDPLTVSVTGAAGGIVELRPFGATVAIVCAVPSAAGAAGTPPPASETTVTIPRPLLARAMAASRTSGTGSIAASLEVARRNRILQALGGAATRMSVRVSVEVRWAATVELRP